MALLFIIGVLVALLFLVLAGLCLAALLVDADELSRTNTDNNGED